MSTATSADGTGSARASRRRASRRRASRRRASRRRASRRVSRSTVARLRTDQAGPVGLAGLVGLVALTATLLVGTLPAGALPALQSSGSSFAGVAISTWTHNAAILYGTNINFQISNSVTGLSFFAQNQIDFGASDIPYSTGQSPYNPSQPYQYLPDVAGGLALMYNLENPSTGQRVTNLNLNAETVADIFLGRITNWGASAITALNPELAGADVPITAVFRSDGAGENYLLSDYLLHEANATFVAAQTQFGLSTTGPSAIGTPSATWPQPACQADGGCTPRQLPGYPGWTTGTGLDGAAGADISATDVASAGSNGAITYVETAYAKEHQLPVANLVNATGHAVQPTSVDVATALESAILHADLTQDLTNVYSSAQPSAYPLSAYSYLVSPCSPTQASAQHIACAGDPGGAMSAFPADKGAELGQFVNFLACGGQQGMANLGYSPLPPNLVQEDFYAIGRMNGGRQPPSPTAANCKNPYVDGQTPLPGEPVIQGVTLPSSAVTATTSPGGSTGGGGGSGGGGTGSAGSKSGDGGSTGGVSAATVSAACAALSRSDATLAAAACTADGTLAKGYAFVNGQIVAALPGGEARVVRADRLLAATADVWGPHGGAVVLWMGVAVLVLAGPPLVARYRRKRRTTGGRA